MKSVMFEFNPLRTLWMDREREYNEQLQIAESLNVTGKFIQTLKKSLNHFAPRNINIVVYGPVRDGKSYSAISIGYMIVNHIKDAYGKTVQLYIARDDSEFLDLIRKAEFQDVIIVDEKKETIVQEGAMAEIQQVKDIDNICAAKCLTIIKLKPEEIYTTTTNLVLKTHGNDYKNRCNRLLVKYREMGLDKFIGHIIVSIDPILCDDRKQEIVGSCYTCPKFIPSEEEQQKGIPVCQEMIAGYERRKLENIDSILEGSPENRAKLVMVLAKEFSALPIFEKLKTKDSRVAYLRTCVNDPEKLPSATNRRLTISEISQIEAMSKVFFEEKQLEGKV